MEQKKQKNPGEAIRLNKFLSDAGVCSRRQADRYVEEGRILVDGMAPEMGQKVTPNQTITIDGKPIRISRKRILLVVNKPRGIVCTTSKEEKDNIVDYLNYPERIYPVGRLDKDSEGLILMTNDGALMDEILRARNRHEKEYEVTVNKPLKPDFLAQMADGVELTELGVTTRPCKIKKMSTYTFRIILTQGLNRQIRRMCEELGYRVRNLQRIRIMNIELGDLTLGKYRDVTAKEWKELEAMIKKGNAPKKSEAGDRPTKPASTERKAGPAIKEGSTAGKRRPKGK